MENTVKILAVGDVVSQAGCDRLREVLPALKKQKEIDAVIVNGENSAVGNGMTAFSCEHIFSSGADVITGGNHSFKRREFYDTLDNSLSILRPANYSDDCVGRGYMILDKGSFRIGVVNMLGVTFLEPLRNPFVLIDEIIEKLKKEV
jgi:calcineurin-like phosphoesterase